MNTALKLVLSLLLLAGFGVVAYLWLAPASAPLALERDVTPTKPLEAPASAPLEAQDALAAEGGSAERSSVAKETKTAAPAAKADAAAEPALVVAHIVDESLRPIANAWLRPEEYRSKYVKPDPKLEVRTGDDGIAKLSMQVREQSYSRRFAAGADGYATLFPSGIPKAGETLHLGDLVLRPGGSVRGRVVDKAQRPVADAQVVVADVRGIWNSNGIEQLRNTGPSLWEGAPQSASGVDGSFLVQGVPAGMTRAWARSGSGSWAVSEPIEVQAGVELRDVVLVVLAEGESDPALGEIEGIVVGPDDKPIPHADVGVQQKLENNSWGTSMEAGADGRFRIKPRDRDVKITLDISDPKERYTQMHLENLKPGTKDLVVRLEEPKTVQFAVSDEHGAVESFRVRWGSEKWNIGRTADKDEKHAGGLAVVRVPSEGSLWYRVEAAGHKPEELGPLEGSRLAAEMTIKLQTIPGIHGRVLAGKEPVAGAKVSLYRQPADEQIEMNGFTTLVGPDKETEATSGTDGSFTLDLQKDGPFSIFADAEGYARAQAGPLQLEAKTGLTDLVLQLDGGGVLEGKVLMPPGRSPAGVIVGINRGDARPLTQVVGPEGTFRFEHLTAGAWEIQRAEAEFRGATSTSTSSGDNVHPGTLRSDFTILVGQTTRKDLDLSDSGTCVLEIDLSNNSAPARAWSIVAWPKGKNTFNGSPPSATTDSNGHARLEADEAGVYSLTIKPPPETGSAFNDHAEITLQHGPNSWSRNVLTGRVEGTITGWNPESGERWRLQEGDSPFFGSNFLQPDAAGHFVVPLLAAGTIDVMHFKNVDAQSEWEKLQSFELVAGQTKTLQLP